MRPARSHEGRWRRSTRSRRIRSRRSILALAPARRLYPPPHRRRPLPRPAAADGAAEDHPGRSAQRRVHVCRRRDEPADDCGPAGTTDHASIRWHREHAGSHSEAASRRRWCCARGRCRGVGGQRPKELNDTLETQKRRLGDMLGDQRLSAQAYADIAKQATAANELIAQVTATTSDFARRHLCRCHRRRGLGPDLHRRPDRQDRRIDPRGTVCRFGRPGARAEGQRRHRPPISTPSWRACRASAAASRTVWASASRSCG